MVVGRTTEGRTVTLTTTSGAATLTGAAGTFNEEDAGRPISATGIPAGATVLSVQSDTAATLSANATATGSRSATIGAGGSVNADSGQQYGFVGWSPETDPESEAYTLAANNAGTAQPDRITNPYTSVTQRSRG